MAINVSVHKNLTYDPVKDFAPIALFAVTPFVLVVNASLPINSMADLAAYAKSKPGGLSYASNGPGGAAHLFAELVKTMLGIEMTHVPYKGNAPALNDVVAGHVSLMFVDPSASVQLVREGKLRALGVTTAKRVSTAPELPPLAEAGLPGYDAASWHMFVAPAATPKPIVQRLYARDRRHHQGARRGGGDLQARLRAVRRRPAGTACARSCRARSSAGARWCARPAPPGSSRSGGMTRPDPICACWRCWRSRSRRPRRRRTIPTAP